MKKENSRRDFIKKSAALALGTLAATSVANKALATTDILEKEMLLVPEGGKFTLPKLPYEYDALEPHIDKLTMEIHYSKHHQAYVTNLNKAFDALAPDVAKNLADLDDVFANMDKLPVAMRNNAGGHFNHEMFWQCLTPNTETKPSEKLLQKITEDFGSIEAMKTQFTDAAKTRFGSGWAWLVKDKSGKLVIGSTPNQDNPLMNISELKGTPILCLDVWEHAYYLRYQNKRADYITNFWKIVNWDFVNANFEK